MQASALQRHNIVLVVVLLTLLFSLTFFRHATTYQVEIPPVNDLQLPLDQQSKSSTAEPSSQVNTSPPPPLKQLKDDTNDATFSTICNNVDFNWLYVYFFLFYMRGNTSLIVFSERAYDCVNS